MDYSEKWAKDVDSAVELALKDLKLSRDEVEIEVLNEPTKGFLGLGSKLAKVRVTKKSDKDNTKEAAAETGAVSSSTEEKTEEKPFMDYGVKDLRSNKPKKGPKTAKGRDGGRRGRGNGNRSDRYDRRDRHESYDDGPLQAKDIKSIIANRPENLTALTDDDSAMLFIKDVLTKMSLELNVSGEGNEEIVYLNLDGKDAGTIIGKRGQTLDAIQYLTSLVINSDHDQRKRVVVDAENYREKREKTLQQLAVRLGNKAIKTGRTVKLEPMNPYERMVIHATLHDSESITTRSEGDEPYRRVIIEQK